MAEKKEHVHTLACGCTEAMAPGWAALERHLGAVRGEAPTYFSAADDEDDALVESVACFRVEGDAPHWHFVSCGISELYDKQFINPEVSGHGFELTIRVPAAADEPPAWPMKLLRNLGRYVAATRRAFSEGEHMNAHAPLALEVPCTLTAVCFVEDPELRSIQTPNGALAFLQVLGLTEDELEAVMDGDAHDFIALVAQRNPSFISAADRPSYLDDEELAAQIADRIATEGSSTAGSAAGDLRIEEEDGTLLIHLGAIHARALIRGLRHRVPFDREYVLSGRSCELLLAPATEVAWHADEERATLMLTAEVARALADELGAGLRGRYTVPALPRAAVELHPTELTDDEGNVVRVLG